MPRPWSLLDPCVPVHLPAAFFRYCVSRGVQASDLLQGVGLPARVLDRPQTQLSYAQVRQLVENALKHTGDPALGLKFGLQIRLSHLGPYGVALLSAPTLRDAMTVVGRFHTLLGPAMRLMPEIGSRQVAIEVSKAIPMGSIHVFNQEVLVSGTLRILRTLLERELRGLRVAFDYARPAHGAQCSLLSAPVRWNQARCTVTFDAEGVDRRLPGADDAAHDAATRQCERLLARVPGRDEDWLGQARAELLRSLDELPSADRLARALNVSRRTLYRRLAEYGTSYGALCDDVRKSLAEDHLAHTGVPLVELAQILGYNDASNFSKAFKRWTGKAPGAWRASLEGS